MGTLSTTTLISLLAAAGVDTNAKLAGDAATASAMLADVRHFLIENICFYSYPRPSRDWTPCFRYTAKECRPGCGFYTLTALNSIGLNQLRRPVPAQIRFEGRPRCRTTCSERFRTRRASGRRCG